MDGNLLLRNSYLLLRNGNFHYYAFAPHDFYLSAYWNILWGIRLSLPVVAVELHTSVSAYPYRLSHLAHSTDYCIGIAQAVAAAPVEQSHKPWAEEIDRQHGEEGENNDLSP